MGRNVELKARAGDPGRQRGLAAALSGSPPEVMRQEDVFFRSPGGRLKLRILDARRGELIFYRREDRPDPKPSEYLIAPISDPAPLRRVLEAGLGLRGIVRKTRTLFKVGRTRIHLDEVEGLGSFLELEVVLDPEESAEEGVREARRLARSLEVAPSDLLDRAYIDILEERASKRLLPGKR